VRFVKKPYSFCVGIVTRGIGIVFSVGEDHEVKAGGGCSIPCIGFGVIYKTGVKKEVVLVLAPV
jgi:hypothetical protein